MKGLLLNIKICTISAFVIGVVMAILNLYNSWSQHAGTNHDPILYSTLFLIAIGFMMSSFEHPDKARVLNKIFVPFKSGKMDLRVEHLLRVISYLFGGVLTFSVNSEIAFVSTMHLIFTGLAIGMGYVLILTYSTNAQNKTLSIVGVSLGAAGFLLAYFFNLYSVAWGEVIASIPLLVWIHKTID